MSRTKPTPVTTAQGNAAWHYLGTDDRGRELEIIAVYVLEREDVRLADGTRVTDQVAAEIAEDVLRSVGRPSLSGVRQRSPQIAFRVPPWVRDQVAEVAAREGKTVSELAREALEERLAASRRWLASRSAGCQRSDNP